MFEKITYLRVHLRAIARTYTQRKQLKRLSGNDSVASNLMPAQIIALQQDAHHVHSLTNSYTKKTILGNVPVRQTQWQLFHTGSKHNNKQDVTKSVSGESKIDGTIEEEEPLVALYDESGNKLSNWTRMKMMMKAYGYVIIPVHWIIAPVWFGAFYMAVKHGIDIVPLLRNIGVNGVYLSKLQNSGASEILQAYAMYKVATPARYTVTLATTEMTIRALRKRGFMKPLPPKEKTYRESMKETYAGMKDKMEDVKDKMSEVRDKLKDN